jgi:two-component system response regulator YesN
LSETGKVIDVRVHTALSVLNKQFADSTLSVAKLSDVLGVCEDHFGKLFKREVKVSFCHYLRQIRIEQAKYLLQNSNHEIKEIAAAVRYTSHSYFTRDFREHVGISPREFREAARA